MQLIQGDPTFVCSGCLQPRAVGVSVPLGNPDKAVLCAHCIGDSTQLLLRLGRRDEAAAVRAQAAEDQLRQVRAEVDPLRLEVKGLKARNAELEAEISRLQPPTAPIEVGPPSD